jgi:membrane protein DedA with SNARE-associated domain
MRQFRQLGVDAPFVAALGSMHYRRFLAYNVAGGFLWVTALVGVGYAFGNVERNAAKDQRPAPSP